MARRAHDFYETPAFMAEAMMWSVPEIRGRILEPCVGDGSLLRVLKRFAAPTCSHVTNDLDPKRQADHHFDARDRRLYEAVGPVDWIVTNPPFSPEIMFPILKLAVEHARCGVVLLGRISFLEPVRARGPWLFEHPPSRYLVTERHSFTGNGKSDSCTTAWMVWSRFALIGRPIECLFGWKDAQAQAMKASA